MTTHEQLTTPNPCNWCPGCGDFGIWSGFKQACVDQGWDSSNTAIVAGIGCHGHIVNFVKITAFEGLHGRSLPVATGIKLANNRLNVFAFAGDGDCLAEGGNHFIHTARRNHDITVILHDNAVYGLTTGQTSPRSPKGYKSKSTPDGSLEEPLHPLRMAIAAGATFVARVYSGDVDRVAALIVRAQQHRGFAVIQMLQPCVTFNKLYTHKFFQENIYELGSEYNPRDKEAAFLKTLEWDYGRIPVGVLYENTDELSYEQQIPHIRTTPIVEQPIATRDVSSLYKHYQ